MSSAYALYNPLLLLLLLKKHQCLNGCYRRIATEQAAYEASTRGRRLSQAPLKRSKKAACVSTRQIKPIRSALPDHRQPPAVLTAAAKSATDPPSRPSHQTRRKSSTERARSTGSRERRGEDRPQQRAPPPAALFSESRGSSAWCWSCRWKMEALCVAPSLRE